MGFLKGERVLGKMQEITGPQRIEDLKIPFTAVATDMIKGKEVVFDTGDLYAAMRASISIPGVFTPVIDEKCTLVDGGVLNPLPLNLANFADESLVVAVSLNGCDALPSLSSDAQQRIEDGLDKEIDGNNRSWINRFLHYGKPKQPVSTSVANTAEHTRLSLINLLANSYEMTQDKLVELTINAYKPDILIEVPRTSCGIFDFHKAQHMLDIGEQCYNLAVDKLLSGSDADRAPLQLSKMRKSRV
jgi:NTE family protein